MEGDGRWSKPHVSCVSMHSLIELRSLILKGTVFLDLEGGNLNEILDVLLEKILHNGGGGGLTFEKIEPTKAVIMKKHRHQFEGRKKLKSETNLSSRASSSTLSRMISFDHGLPAGSGLSREESLSEVNVSAFVCYITRFTEECFASLIAVIFIVKAFEKVASIAYQFPLEPDDRNCSGLGERPESNSTPKLEQPVHCSSHNVFLMSLLLFFGTYFLATFLKKFKNEKFFPAVFRNYISDFSVIIAILLMVNMDFLLEVRTPSC